MNRMASAMLGMSLGLAFAALFTWWSRSPPSEGVEGPPIQDVLQAHSSELELDPSTLRDTWKLADGARAELDGYRARIQEERTQLRELLGADPVDLPLMHDHLERLGELETTLRTRELEVMLEIRSVLTEPQRARLREITERR